MRKVNESYAKRQFRIDWSQTLTRWILCASVISTLRLKCVEYEHEHEREQHTSKTKKKKIRISNFQSLHMFNKQYGLFYRIVPFHTSTCCTCSAKTKWPKPKSLCEYVFMHFCRIILRLVFEAFTTHTHKNVNKNMNENVVEDKACPFISCCWICYESQNSNSHPMTFCTNPSQSRIYCRIFTNSNIKFIQLENIQ